MFRKVLSELIEAQAGFAVTDVASNGKIALEKLKSGERPDVILSDLEMPELDGIGLTKDVVEQYKLPVIILSGASTRESKRVLDAMDAGAIDFIEKPAAGIDALREELFLKLRGAVSAQPRLYTPASPNPYAFHSTSEKIIVVASSTGGPQTLEAFLTELPGNIPAPILIVQHMPPLFTRSLAARLNRITDIEVREAKEGDALEPGVALIAPGGFHMEVRVDRPGGRPRIALNQGARECGVRPNANKLFRSVATLFGERVIGIVLTGMGHDGTLGSRAIRERHGTIIAEAEESCVIFGMPKSVVAEGLADEVLPIDKMAVGLIQLLDV